MSVHVQIPVALARYANGEDSIEVDGTSVQETIGAVMKKFPELKSHLIGGDGKLRHFVNIYVNDEDIRHGKYMETPLKSGDVVTIVPSIAGGA